MAAWLGIGVLLTPGTSSASALCKTKKGGLVIRDTCKKKDVQVDASLLGSLGLQGPPGPEGPAGPSGPSGPSGGGLTVVDKDGEEVGLVYSIGEGYYGGTYTNVLRELTAPGANESEFFGFGVSPTGIVTHEDYYGYGTFATSDCTGARYVRLDCEYGECDSGPMFHSLSIGEDLTATFHRASERVHGNYTSSSTVSADTAENVAAICTARGNGTIKGAVEACDEDPSRFCGTCCYGPYEGDAAPERTLDLSTLGLEPPFELHR
jgi:hypothetical protein